MEPRNLVPRSVSALTIATKTKECGTFPEFPTQLELQETIGVFEYDSELQILANTGYRSSEQPERCSSWRKCRAIAQLELVACRCARVYEKWLAGYGRNNEWYMEQCRSVWLWIRVWASVLSKDVCGLKEIIGVGWDRNEWESLEGMVGGTD